MDDLISRQAAIDALSHMMDIDGFRDGWAVSRANVDCMLRSLPSAQLEKCTEERTKTHACDYISREDVLNALCKAVHKNDDTIPCPNQIVSCLWDKTKVQDYVKEILKLSPVTPQPKVGHWIKNAPEYQNIDPPYICSECGNLHLRKTNYCDQCGCRMVEQQESEEA